MRRVAELDGVRGAAVIMVVWARMWNGVKPTGRRLLDGAPGVSGGGFVGVQLFFVLSGFLITSLLLAEQSSTGGVSLRAFYARRARRLLPAVAVLLGVFLVIVLAARTGDERADGLGSIVRAALYVENLDPLFRWIPHDEYLNHTWSLAVEEQFYLLWPLVVVGVMRRRPSALAAVAAAVIVATVIGRYVLSATDIQVYELMHWDAVMAGCLLAIRPIRFPRWAPWAALAVMGALTAHAGGLLGSVHLHMIATAAAVPLVAGATSVPFLRSGWLRYFGRISYGFYLWHAFLMRFGWPVLPSVVASLAVAELSFRLVEQPLRRPTPSHHQPRAAPAQSPVTNETTLEGR